MLEFQKGIIVCFQWVGVASGAIWRNNVLMQIPHIVIHQLTSSKKTNYYGPKVKLKSTKYDSNTVVSRSVKPW
jgi:hypothetical protein